MFDNLYYTLKSFVPRSALMWVRRKRAHWLLKRIGDRWPIDPNSAQPPVGWQGWPDGKRFALVLTHDVESVRGQDQCIQLMKLENNIGLRSSFNFVAEKYTNHADTFNELRSHGFEIGMHGIYHHENMFRSYETFAAQVTRINKYLQDWNAKGFRAPCMYHNLEWTRELDIEYDASTFDTDPFEPQPDGVGTIFPFLVPGSGKKDGYIELPYTLPQDFTLFILLREKSIDIWKRKIDWIAEKGGMALLITHPDYMNFNGRKDKNEQYPVDYYLEILEYILEKYKGQYWMALPKEIARFCATNEAVRKSPWRKNIHACMLSYSFYESDNRVMRYAETLAKRGDHVDAICLRKGKLPVKSKLREVNTFRIQERAVKEKSQLMYILRLSIFFVRSLILLSILHIKKPYDLIHVHNMPEFLVFASVFPKLYGARILLDIHDLTPELYATKFNKHRMGLLFKIMVSVERLCCMYSDHTIIANDVWYERITKRSVSKEKCTVILNYPDESIFFPRTRKREDDKFIMIYPGSLNWHQGVDIAIKAFALIKDEVAAVFHIYGEGNFRQELEELIDQLELVNRVYLMGSLPIERVAERMAEADLGIEPKRNDPFAGDALSTKILEFMSLGIPVIVSATRVHQYYFKEPAVRFFRAEDEQELAKWMLALYRDDTMRRDLAQKGHEFAQDYVWEKKKENYLKLVDQMTRKKGILMENIQAKNNQFTE